MHYYLYRVTNKVNGKIYVGVHKTQNLDDGYMGSGKVIKAAIKKHGAENFQKEILETFVSAEAMFAREKEIVTEEFISKDDVYNLRRGGTGGFDYINSSGLNLYGGNGYNFTEEARERGKVNAAIAAKTDAQRKVRSERMKRLYPEGPFKGKTHSEATKQRSRR